MRGGNPNGKPVGFRQHNQRAVIPARWWPVPAPQSLKAVPGSESVLRYGCAVLWWRGGSGPAMHRLSGVRAQRRWCRPGNWQTTKAATEKFLHLSAWLVLLLVWNCFLSFIDKKSGINYRILPKTATKLRKKYNIKGKRNWEFIQKKHIVLMCLVAGVRLERATSRLWAWRATNCSTPRCFLDFECKGIDNFPYTQVFARKNLSERKNCF